VDGLLGTDEGETRPAGLGMWKHALRGWLGQFSNKSPLD